MANKGDIVSLRLNLKEELKTQLKVIATVKRTSMNGIVVKLIEKYIQEEKIKIQIPTSNTLSEIPKKQLVSKRN